MHDRFVTLIKNSQGLYDYENGMVASPYFDEIELNEEEFNTISDSGYWGKVNDKCGLLIDDYESELIPYDKIDVCISIYDELGLTHDNTFFKVLMNAKKSAAVALDF